MTTFLWKLQVQPANMLSDILVSSDIETDLDVEDTFSGNPIIPSSNFSGYETIALRPPQPAHQRQDRLRAYRCYLCTRLTPTANEEEAKDSISRAARGEEGRSS